MAEIPGMRLVKMTLKCVPFSKNHSLNFYLACDLSKFYLPGPRFQVDPRRTKAPGTSVVGARGALPFSLRRSWATTAAAMPSTSMR